jgi:hypothetical protein
MPESFRGLRKFSWAPMLNCRIDNENTTPPRSDSLACARPQNMKMEAYRCILLGPPFPSMGKGQDRGAKEPIKSNHPYLYPSPSRGRSWRAGGLLYKSAINPAPTRMHSIYTFKLRALRVLRGEISVSTLVAAMPRWALRALRALRGHDLRSAQKLTQADNHRCEAT